MFILRELKSFVLIHFYRHSFYNSYRSSIFSTPPPLRSFRKNAKRSSREATQIFENLRVMVLKNKEFRVENGKRVGALFYSVSIQDCEVLSS